MDFRKLLSPKSQRASAEHRKALIAFQEMSPEEMARTLLDGVRKLRASDAFSQDPRYSYDEWAMYRVVPELAMALDPSIELEEVENPKEEERFDQVTWLRGATKERLSQAVDSIIANGSFARIRGRSEELEELSEVLFGRGISALTIAADTAFPGSHPKRETADTRDPLPGKYIICRHITDYHRVLNYSEDDTRLNKIFDVAVAYKQGLDISDEDESIKGILRRDTWFSRQAASDEPQNVVSIEIQSFDGEVLRCHEFAPELEEEAETPEP